METKLTAEQIRSAVELARNVVEISDKSHLSRLALKFAPALLDMYGRLQEAETREVISRGTLSTADIEINNYRAELTEARNYNAIQIGQLETLERERDKARATICKRSENTADALRERDEARKEIESVAEHAKAMENSSDSYRERLDEARKRLDVLDGCNQQWAAKAGDLRTDLDEARGQLDIARKDMRDVAAETKRVVRCGCLGCLTDDCDHWGVDCHLKDYTLCHIGRTVDNQITPTETQS